MHSVLQLLTHPLKASAPPASPARARSEERDDGFLFGAVVFAESHKAAMAVGAGAPVLERFYLGLEGCFVDDTAAIRAQQLFEFEVAGHGSSSSTNRSFNNATIGRAASSVNVRIHGPRFARRASF